MILFLLQRLKRNEGHNSSRRSPHVFNCFLFFFQHLFEKEEEESAETLYKTLPHETAQKKNSLKTGGDPIWDCTSRRSPLPGILLFYYSKYMQLASLLGEKVSRIFSHKKRNSKFKKKQKKNK